MCQLGKEGASDDVEHGRTTLGDVHAKRGVYHCISHAKSDPSRALIMGHKLNIFAYLATTRGVRLSGGPRSRRYGHTDDGTGAAGVEHGRQRPRSGRKCKMEALQARQLIPKNRGNFGSGAPPRHSGGLVAGGNLAFTPGYGVCGGGIPLKAFWGAPGALRGRKWASPENTLLEPF